MRSTSRFSDTSTVLRTSVESPSVTGALAGETGIGIVDDYRGIPVLSAFRRFEFEGISWAVLAEQDVSEVFERMPEIRNLLIAGDLKGAMAEARRNKMLFLQESALRKVVDGLTTIEEVVRVTASPQKPAATRKPRPNPAPAS